MGWWTEWRGAEATLPRVWSRSAGAEAGLDRAEDVAGGQWAESSRPRPQGWKGVGVGGERSFRCLT